MTIAQQLNAVKEALKPFAEDKGLGLDIAGDPFEALLRLKSKPGAGALVIFSQGEVKRGEYEETGAVDRNFAVIVSRGQALTIEPGASLVKGAAGGEPLFDLIEQARDVVRAIQFEDPSAPDPTTEVTPNYLGFEPYSVEGRLMDAYQLNFQIGSQLPAAA